MRAVVLRDFLRTIPVILDEIVADDAPLPNDVPPTTFRIVRMLKDYRYEESAEIDIDSGKVLSDAISQRVFPIVSAPDQWVVLPVAKDHWMSDADYAALVQRLSKRFNLDTTTNLNVAIFNR